MNKEIKEIEHIMICLKEHIALSNDEDTYLLDYITNLQQENKEWGMIFDTFSSRPYAHRYLEEKRKELGNKRIIGLDSEMIYKEYYDLKEIEQDHKQTNATLMSELAKLEEENERLKFQLENQQIISSKYRMRRNIYKSRCEKAIEYIKEAIENGEYFEDDIATDISEPSYDKYVNSSSLLNILQNESEGVGYNEKICKKYITEEIADVMVMLKQFQYYYGIDDEQIEEIMKYKIDRQLIRIKNETNERLMEDN